MNEIWSFVEKWMDVQSVIHYEVRKKQVLYINTYMWNLGK